MNTDTRHPQNMVIPQTVGFGIGAVSIIVGGILLILSLVTAWVRLRGSEARLLGFIFQIVYAIVIVSVPIGLVLAHL